jgi:hypothetical protein
MNEEPLCPHAIALFQGRVGSMWEQNLTTKNLTQLCVFGYI